MQLNEQQKAAINFKKGNAFVTSVPGSGKTTMLTSRAISLLKDGVHPQNILCITFTNKAANEMKNRIVNSIGDASISKHMWIKTFHSLAANILRKDCDSLGYIRDFTILDVDDQKTIMKKGADDLGFKVQNKKNRNGVDINKLLSKISYKKDTLESDEKFFERVSEDEAHIYNYYEEYLTNSNSMDFGDLLLNLHYLFNNNENVLKKYSKRFEYIMVDECQDLNVCQYEIAKMISSYHNNLMFIGDIDQSIYKFRQADPKNIQNFIKQNEVTTLPLSYNYRSSKKILKCAENLINNNDDRIKMNLNTLNDNGDNVKIIYSKNHKDESKYVAEEIRNLKNKYQYKWSDFAILYRTNTLGRDFEQQLRSNSIPCRVIGGTSFFDFKVVKICLNYLQLYSNPYNTLAFNKVINKPRRSIDEKTLSYIEKYCFKNRLTIVEALEDIDIIDIANIGPKRKKELRKFHQVMKVDENKDNNLYNTAKRIFEDSGLYDFILSLDGSDANKNKSVGNNEEVYESFMDMLADWDEGEKGGLDSFLEYINLQTNNDKVDNQNSVKLMTMHTAKGLEFPAVFVVCAEEGFVPHQFSIDSGLKDEIEEERRLFYVAMTRAKKHLYTTFSQNRMQFGKLKPRNVSRFIKEFITEDCVSLIKNYEE